MKFFLSALLLITVASYSQSPVIPLRSFEEPTGTGYYLKDTYNDFDPYIGTWKYQNLSTNSFLVIKFKKKQAYFSTVTNHYSDHLVGEYQYIENGIEIINTLAGLDSVSNPYFNKISGSLIYQGKYGFSTCIECPDDVIRIKLSFDDPERMFNSGGIDMWHKTEADGTKKIMIDLYYDGLGLRFWEHPNEPTTLRIPYGKYTLTKVQ